MWAESAIQIPKEGSLDYKAVRMRADWVKRALGGSGQSQGKTQGGKITMLLFGSKSRLFNPGAYSTAGLQGPSPVY